VNAAVAAAAVMEGVGMGAFRSIDLFSYVLWIVIVFVGWFLAKTVARRAY
jgi:hypothetical protein